MSISAVALTENLERAFHAALMLTGTAKMAEKCVLDGLVNLTSSDDIVEALVAKAVESAIRQRIYFPNQLEQALARLPQELGRMIFLAPVARDCYMLRILFRIPPASCAAILNLTIEELEASLCEALQNLSLSEYSPPSAFVRQCQR
jgi:hypothetical protein